jgi:hypothetical protein
MYLKNKYYEIPSAWAQLRNVLIILLAGGLCLYFFLNFDMELKPDTKRFFTRLSVFLLMAGALLFSYGVLWSRKNQHNSNCAFQEIQEKRPLIKALDVEKQLSADMNVSRREEVLRRELAKAETEYAKASSFEENEFRVNVGAMVLVTLGTVLQALVA